MLLRIEIAEIEQRCDYCGATRTLPLNEIQAGVEAADPPSPLDPNVIGLPVCSACGSKEFLIRVARIASGADAATLDHHRGVNALHAALVKSGRIAPTLVAYFATESVSFDVAGIPWVFAHEPVPPVSATAIPDPAVAAFAAFLDAKKDGA
jgi:hypothetical protein